MRWREQSDAFCDLDTRLSAGAAGHIIKGGLVMRWLRGTWDWHADLRLCRDS